MVSFIDVIYWLKLISTLKITALKILILEPYFRINGSLVMILVLFFRIFKLRPLKA